MANKIYSYKIGAFNGGLNTKQNIIDLPPNQSPDLLNVDLDNVGAIQSRNGVAPFNSAAVCASATLDGIFSYCKDGGHPQALAFGSGCMYLASYNSSSFAIKASSVYTAGTPVSAYQVNNIALISTGYSTPLKWDGTAITLAGVSAPTTPLSATVSSAGVLNGYYQYLYTSVNTRGAESTYTSAAISNIVYASGQSVNLTGIPSATASTDIAAWNIYRNLASLIDSAVSSYPSSYIIPTNWYYTGQVLNGVTTFWDDYTDDTVSQVAGTVAATIPIDNYPVPQCTIFCTNMGITFAAGDPNNKSVLYVSEPNQPETWHLNQSQKVGDGDGLEINDIFPFTNGILISKVENHANSNTGSKGVRSKMYILYTPADGSWQLFQSNIQYGSEGRTMVRMNGQIAFMNRNGAFLVHNISNDKLTVENIGFNIQNTIQNFGLNYMRYAKVINYNNKLWFSVPSTAGSTYNDAVYCYNYLMTEDVEQVYVGDQLIGANNKVSNPTGAWLLFKSNSYKYKYFTIHQGNLLASSATEPGRIYTLDTGHYDASSSSSTIPIESYFKTIMIGGDPAEDHDQHNKNWLWAYITLETTGNWNLEVYNFRDFFVGAGEKHLISCYPDLTYSGLWDQGLWDQAVWDNDPSLQVRKRVKVKFKNSTGRYIQFQFRTDNANNYFKIHGLEIWYGLRGLR